MSKESEVFIKEIHKDVLSVVKDGMNIIFGQTIILEDTLGGVLSKSDIIYLRSIHFSIKQKRVFQFYLVSLLRMNAFSILSMIDGIAMDDENVLPDLDLINRDTGKSIIDDQYLHEEFVDFDDEFNKLV